jgi:hypothetical protein
LRVECFEERLIEIRDCRNGRFAVDLGKRHPRTEKRPVDAVEGFDRPSQMNIEPEMPHPLRVPDIVQQGFEEGDRKVMARVIDLENCDRVCILVPQYPRREERVKNRLDKRGAEKARALFIIDVEGESERLPIVIQQ